MMLALIDRLDDAIAESIKLRVRITKLKRQRVKMQKAARYAITKDNGSTVNGRKALSYVTTDNSRTLFHQVCPDCYRVAHENKCR